MTMRHFLSLRFLGIFVHTLHHCTVLLASEFYSDGDYLIGGIFNIHLANNSVYHRRPESIDCSSQSFSLSAYRKFQLMRFSIEEINNSTKLLPNVPLGYEVLDLCSDTENFPGIMNLVSFNGMIQPWKETHKNLSCSPKVVAVVGPYSSTNMLTVAPLLALDHVPVVSYGAASSVFSQKSQFPFFLRTVHSNKDLIDVIVEIILHFNWRWVAFLNSDNDFGIDGLEVFRKRIKDTDICLAYTKGLSEDTNYSQMFKQLEAQRVNIIVMFATNMNSEAVIESAVRLNVSSKVWIAGENWSLNKRLMKMKGIQNIGTVLGVSQPLMTIPGFSDFIYSIKSHMPCKNTEQNRFCYQNCNGSSLLPEDIISMDPSYSFQVYSAVYAIAHALHNVLQCGVGKCNKNIKVYPHMILEELKQSNFTLLNASVKFKDNGDPKIGYYSIIFWDQSGDAKEIGIYKFYPKVSFFLNGTKIQWYTKGEKPISQCSSECPVGYVKMLTGFHKCCFDCEICPNGTYINSSVDPFNCISCMETEWSPGGSTSCSLRLVEYIPFTDGDAIVIVVLACILLALAFGVSVLFANNYNTPVVRSAGGPMCFLILGCLSLSSLSVFFYFGEPTTASCVFRLLPFLLFYTICLACFVVRSFQIVCIFKMAASFPKLHSWWMKYHGQTLLITVTFITQAILLILGYCFGPPHPHSNMFYQDKVILGCNINLAATISSVVLPLSLCCLCFIFSYMGKDLPKNYNEAKAITFCLLLLTLTWIIFATVSLRYQGKHIHTFNALAVLSSLFCFLLWYFLPKCYIIIFQPRKNTHQYFQGLIQSYTKTISQ